MTDFVTRLAERTLGLASAVRPLVVSRFAPGPAVVDHAGEVIPDVQSQEVERKSVGAEIPSFPGRGMPIRLRQTVSTPSLVSQEAPAVPVQTQIRQAAQDIRPPLARRAILNRAEQAGVAPSPVAPVPDGETEPALNRPERETPAQLPRLVSTSSPVSPPKETRSQTMRVSPVRGGPDTGSLPERPVEPDAEGQGHVSLAPSRDLPATGKPTTSHPPALIPESFPTIPLLVPPRDLPVTVDQQAISGPPAETPDGVAGPQGPSEMFLSGQGRLLERQPVAAFPGSQETSTLALVRPNVTARQERARAVLGRREKTLSGPSSSPPAVRVTIGRVEVRAVQPPAPPPPSAPRGPALSLDDYLKQRSEGLR
jgi:hypothetical protein